MQLEITKHEHDFLVAIFKRAIEEIPMSIEHFVTFKYEDIPILQDLLRKLGVNPKIFTHAEKEHHSK